MECIVIAFSMTPFGGRTDVRNDGGCRWMSVDVVGVVGGEHVIVAAGGFDSAGGRQCMLGGASVFVDVGGCFSGRFGAL